MSNNYTKYLQSEDWLKKKTNKKYNSHNRCALCLIASNLHVHHLNYKKLVDVKNSDLRILCEDCHCKVHEMISKKEVVFDSSNHNHRFSRLRNYFYKKFPDKLALKRKNLKAYEEIRDDYKKIELRQPKNIYDVKIVTQHIIDMGRSYRGGWNLKQLQLFGFNKVKKDWYKLIINQEWPRETISQFIALKNKHLKSIVS